ncbi:MAG TPA: LytR C-terminal domain-containing protein [Acidimicrobiales bacterium]|jgi:hypothetical protein
MVPERTQARANPARGIALIATAVILGIFLLRNGWEDGSSAAANGANITPPTNEGGQPEGGAAATTPTTAAPRPAGEVTVKVMNASGVSGAARKLTDQVSEAGWGITDPTDAPGGTDPATTWVFFLPGYETEAKVLAGQVTADETKTQPLANPPQVDPGPAQLVVILGTDHAND